MSHPNDTPNDQKLTELMPQDLEFHSWPPDVPGAMKVGMKTGLLIVHKPTGHAVVAMSERSQHANRAIGLPKLEAVVIPRAELEALRRDAARYRFAKSAENKAIKLPGIYHGGAYSGRYLFDDDADEAIDAAIAGETK